MTSQIPCFFIGTYKDWELGIRLIAQLRLYYPTEQIICISDGYHAPKLETYCRSNEVQYIKGKRLKLQQYGGAWISRMLDTFIHESEADCLVWLDPDSYLFHPFASFPECDIAGNLREVIGHHQFIQGGCIYISRQACQRILESKMLNNPDFMFRFTFSYRNLQFQYSPLNKNSSTDVLASSDAIITHVKNKLGLQFKEWNDVLCYYDSQLHDFTDYCVIHPVKKLVLDESC